MIMTSHEMLFHVTRIHGQTTAEELRWIHNHASLMPPRCVWIEVGVWCGRSLFAAAMGLPRGATVFAVDTWEGQLPKTIIDHTLVSYDLYPDWSLEQYEVTAKAIRHLRPDIDLVAMKLPSTHAASKFPDKCIDGLFIDGDHYDLYRDIEHWTPKVSPRGLISGHDYRHEFPKVVSAVDRLLPGHHRGSGSIWYQQFRGDADGV